MNDMLERYEIIKEIGSGATSRVYLAEDRAIIRKVAIKQGTPKELLRKEAVFLANHPTGFSPMLYDFWEGEHRVCIIMEFIEGENLKERCKRIGRYTQEEVLQIACMTAKGIDCIHTKNPSYVYGDIKPENIMVQPDGRVRIIDFGTAAKIDEEITAGEIRGGTKLYASPERWQGRLDIRSDIYALGRLMQVLLQMGGEQEIEEKVLRLIEKCIQEQPRYRYQSMSQFLVDAKECLSS